MISLTAANEGRLSDVVRDKEAIHHAIDGGKDRHADRGQCEADHRPIGKVIR